MNIGSGGSEIAGVKIWTFQDTRAGCPPVQEANSDIMLQTITLTKKSIVGVHIKTIGIYNGTFNCWIVIDGVDKSNSGGHSKYLSSAYDAGWQSVSLHWYGELNAGEHTFGYRCDKANAIGCGGQWGGMVVKAMEIE